MRKLPLQLSMALVAGLLASPALARDVVDMTGRTVTVPDTIERVITIGSVCPT